MGGKESKQFPISYDEASKRGEVSFLGLTSTFGAKFEDLVHHMLNCKINSTNRGTFSNSVRKIILMVSMVQGV